MARALIVLSDTYRDRGDSFQARQYLESLRSNYKGGEEDILQMITNGSTNENSMIHSRNKTLKLAK